MHARVAWALNLDADDELARGPAYTSPKGVRERLAALATRLGGLVRPSDVVVPLEPAGAGSIDDASSARGLPGRAFCPTPRALRALERAGALLPDAPPFEVLRRVNHRGFCAALGRMLPGAVYARTRDDVETAVGEPGLTGQWLLKRPFGFVGRGRRRVAWGPLRGADLAWVDASLRAGEGLEVEPWVERAGDFGLHGFLERDGALHLGEPTKQTCDMAGGWIASERAAPGDLHPDEAAALRDATLEAAEALVRAGYFGPFGVDAFRFREPGGVEAFHARCEINARYSMGWAIGMGASRPDLAG